MARHHAAQGLEVEAAADMVCCACADPRREHAKPRFRDEMAGGQPTASVPTSTRARMSSFIVAAASGGRG